MSNSIQKPEHTFTIQDYNFEVFDGDWNHWQVTCNDDGEHRYNDTFHKDQFSVAEIMEHYAERIYDDQWPVVGRGD